MKYIVNYFPNNLSKEQMQMIRDKITPSMEWEDSSQYSCDTILEKFWSDKDIVYSCEWCDYIRL